MTKRLNFILLSLIVAIIVAAVAMSMQAQDAPNPSGETQGGELIAGRDYVVIKDPLPTLDANKVEVTEVFWYGCGHCNTFRPLFDQWQQGLPEDIVTRHSPAMWNKTMEVHAGIFYTAQALGLGEDMHKAVFDAIHIHRKQLLNTDEIYALFAAKGVKREDFDSTFKSFGVRSKVRQADARARGYGITGTPELIVNGKYRISVRQAGSQANMLRVADRLIAREREAMVATKS